MKADSLGKTICYVIAYSVTCYIGMNLCVKNYVNTTRTFYVQLFIETLLHAGAAILALSLLQKIIFFVYVKSNAAFAFMTGLAAISILLILDIQLKNWNVLLFSPKHFFLDSIGTLTAANIEMHFIEKFFLYTQLPYEGGDYS